MKHITITIISILLLVSLIFNGYFITQIKEKNSYITECDKVVGQKLNCPSSTEDMIEEESITASESSSNLISQEVAEEMAESVLSTWLYEQMDANPSEIEITLTPINSYYSNGYWYIYASLYLIDIEGNGFAYPDTGGVKINALSGHPECLLDDYGNCYQML